MGIFGKKKRKPGLFDTVDEAINFGSIQSLLADGSSNEGSLRLKGGLKVDGAQMGDVKIADETGVVWITATGRIKGEVRAAHVYVQGRFEGSIQAEFVVIEGSGRVEGRVFADKVITRRQEGLFFNAEVFTRKAVRDVEANLPGELIPITRAAAA